jgi:hypothetical protein
MTHALLRLLVGVAMVGLVGCVTHFDRLPRSSPLPRPTPLAAVGEFRHAPSGYVFPLQVGAFQRVALLQYDTAGLDVSAGYNDAAADCPVVLTIYVYPTPRMTFIGADPALVRATEMQWLDGAYGAAKQEIARAHAGAILDSEDSRMQNGVPGKKAVYSIGSAQSELLLFVVEHAWFLEYRATYPAECASQGREALGSFFAAWQGRGK